MHVHFHNIIKRYHTGIRTNKCSLSIFLEAKDEDTKNNFKIIINKILFIYYIAYKKQNHINYIIN